jgi:hypothetical protein
VRDSRGEITKFDVAGAGTGAGQGTIPEGINLLGLVAGMWVDGNGANHGFVWTPWGGITKFDVPGIGTGANQGTEPATPNVFGVITGQWVDANNVHFGFLRYP